MRDPGLKSGEFSKHAFWGDVDRAADYLPGLLGATGAPGMLLSGMAQARQAPRGSGVGHFFGNVGRQIRGGNLGGLAGGAVGAGVAGMPGLLGGALLGTLGGLSADTAGGIRKARAERLAQEALLNRQRLLGGLGAAGLGAAGLYGLSQLMGGSEPTPEEQLAEVAALPKEGSAKEARFIPRMGQLAGLGTMAASAFSPVAPIVPMLGAGLFTGSTLANNMLERGARQAVPAAAAASPGMLAGLPPWAKMLGAGLGGYGLYKAFSGGPEKPEQPHQVTLTFPKTGADKKEDGSIDFDEYDAQWQDTLDRIETAAGKDSKLYQNALKKYEEYQKIKEEAAYARKHPYRYMAGEAKDWLTTPMSGERQQVIPNLLSAFMDPDSQPVPSKYTDEDIARAREIRGRLQDPQGGLLQRGKARLDRAMLQGELKKRELQPEIDRVKKNIGDMQQEGWDAFRDLGRDAGDKLQWLGDELRGGAERYDSPDKVRQDLEQAYQKLKNKGQRAVEDVKAKGKQKVRDWRQSMSDMIAPEPE